MNSFNDNDGIKRLCSDLSENSRIDPKLYDKFYVKRGLRNKDGTGVVEVLPTFVMYMAIL